MSQSTALPNYGEIPESEAGVRSSVTAVFDDICANVERVLHGKRSIVELAVTCMAAEGHLLIEDVPGVGKTLLAKALAASLGTQSSRVQCTPDLLPSDLTGGLVLSRRAANASAMADLHDDFTFRPGPLFSSVVVVDEINRATPRTQSALLEAMEEGQVTADGTAYRLPRPHLVIATQNPVEHDGTFPLPESQLDRFLVRTSLGYPARDAEIAVLNGHSDGRDRAPVESLRPVASLQDLAALSSLARSIHVASALKGYIVDLAEATRHHPALRLGVSPRGTVALLRAARVRATTQGRDFVTPDDFQALARPVWGHRLLPRQGGRADDVLGEVLAQVPIPRRR